MFVVCCVSFVGVGVVDLSFSVGCCWLFGAGGFLLMLILFVVVVCSRGCCLVVAGCCALV